MIARSLCSDGFFYRGFMLTMRTYESSLRPVAPKINRSPNVGRKGESCLSLKLALRKSSY